MTRSGTAHRPGIPGTTTEAAQVYARFKIVKNIVSSAEVDCESLTNTLRAIIDAPAGDKIRPITVHLVAYTKLDITHRNR